MKSRNEFRNVSFNSKAFEVLTSKEMNTVFGQGGTDEFEYIDENGNYVYRIVIKK